MPTVIITTIYEATNAVKQLAKRPGVDLVVVGDRKTPRDWHCDGVQYLSVERQQDLNFELVDALPYNHYCRKMIGYLVAARDGAEVIIDTDDDNMPKADWGFPPFQGTYQTMAEDQGFVNVYQWFTSQKIWPRGLPLDLINSQFDLIALSEDARCEVGIWQGLADNDPDVDAIYRLTNGEACFFETAEPLVLSRGTLCPFNSQNTAIRSGLFALLYLPASVTFRFTDILRGLVAQPIMWAAGYQLGFAEASVVQERNPHDLMEDFSSEIPMFLRGRDVIGLVTDAIDQGSTVESNLLSAYRALTKEGLVAASELPVLEAWLADLASCRTEVV